MHKEGLCLEGIRILYEAPTISLEALGSDTALWLSILLRNRSQSYGWIRCIRPVSAEEHCLIGYISNDSSIPLGAGWGLLRYPPGHAIPLGSSLDTVARTIHRIQEENEL